MTYFVQDIKSAESRSVEIIQGYIKHESRIETRPWNTTSSTWTNEDKETKPLYPTQRAPQRPGRAGCLASCLVDPLILLMKRRAGSQGLREWGPEFIVLWKEMLRVDTASGHISQLMRWWRGSNGLETLILYLKVLKLSLKGLNGSLKPPLSAYWIIFNAEDQDKVLTTVAEQILLRRRDGYVSVIQGINQ